MNEVAEIKKLLLRTLAAWAMPVQEGLLIITAQEAFPRRPLLSDILDARRELERDGFISGAKDDLDANVTTWTLTVKGQHKAKQL